MALTLQSTWGLTSLRDVVDSGAERLVMRERQGWQWNCSVRTIQN